MQNLEVNAGFTGILTNPALTGLSGAAATYSFTAFSFAIDGVAYNEAVASGANTPDVNSYTDPEGNVPSLVGTTPATGFKAGLFVWAINAAGDVKVYTRGWQESPSGAPLELLFPEISHDEVIFAYHTVKLGTTVSTSWTYGTGNWNATGVTTNAAVNIVGRPTVGAILVS